jgi:Mg-chelatase subunit ChlD|tara:strand:- start:444 stop:1082 length:639 start_codon:yes stop_codon:yes gene_type:complete
MKKVTNVIVVDASSSMSSKAEEVRDGLKSLLKDIRKDMKKNKGEAKIRTIVTQFAGAGTFKVLLDTSKRKKVTYDSAENYKPSGMTALFDAIGQSFAMVGKKQDGVFVSILTDGDENDSKEFTREDVQKIFKKVDKKNWGLTFMGTTQGAVEAAVSLGIKRSNTLQYSNDIQGTKAANVSRNFSKQMYFASVMEGKVKTKNLVEDDVDEGDN